MDEEQDFQASSTEQLDINSMSFEEAAAAMEAGKFDRTEAPDENGETSASLARFLDEPATEEPAPAETPVQEAEPEAQTPEPQQAQTPPAEDWERKAHSYAGNNRQLQETNAQLRQQLQQFEQQMAAFQQQQADEQELAQIRASLPAEYHAQAEQEFRQRKQTERQQAALLAANDQYRTYLQSEYDQLAQQKAQVFRTALPQHMPDFAEYVAQQIEAPAEPLKAVVQTPAFQKAIGRVSGQQDLDLLGDALVAFAEYHKSLDDQRKTANRERASASGAHRGETGTGVAGGPSITDRIKNMSDTEFLDFADKVANGVPLRR